MLNSPVLLMLLRLCPEVFTSGEVQPALDLFSLGIVLYWMMTGEEPYAGLAPYQVRACHLLMVHLHSWLDVGWQEAARLEGQQACLCCRLCCRVSLLPTF